MYTSDRLVVYTNLHRKMQKNDRLAAGYTLEQYERAYRQAFLNAVREADSDWEIGKPIKSGVLDGITRETVEDKMKKSGSTVTQAYMDMKI